MFSYAELIVLNIKLLLEITHLYSPIIIIIKGHSNLSLDLGDGVMILSANEVCGFLCGETGNDQFCGVDPAHQALVDYWLGWEASELKV